MAQPAEFHRALRLILGRDGRLADEAVVVDFLRYAVQRKLRLADIWVALIQERIIWAAMPVVNPGRTLLLLTPGHAGGSTLAPAHQLIEAICQSYAKAGTHLAQALLDPGAGALRQVYQERGFAAIAELVYLQAQAQKTLPPAPLPAGLRWRAYTPAAHGAFRDAILASYTESLDCPKLNGMRDIEDVIAGHRGAGEHDPNLWLLLCDGDRALGVLLLSIAAPRADMELVYLGLAPEARGRGLGDLMMRQALALAEARQVDALVLAVDAGNQPALRLYFRNGLQRVGAKLALLRDLRPLVDISTAAPRPAR